MYKQIAGVAIGIAALSMSAAAQTVTGSGTANTVPLFAGTSTVGNSVITQSNGVIGWNGTNRVLFSVSGSATNGTEVQVGNTSTGAKNWGWVANGSGGPTDATCLSLHEVTDGSYPLEFCPNWITFYQNVGIGTTSPQQNLSVNGYLNVDQSGADVGGTGAFVYHSISFGSGSGEAIGSDRGSGPNVNGLDFYTDWLDRMSITNSGNVGIGTTSPQYNLDVTGTVHATGVINATTSGVKYPDGNTQTTAWTGVLCGGDYAEAVNAKGSRKSYEPGDVLVIGDDSNGEVQKSVEPYSTLVAGIFATKPGVIGRRQTLVKDADEIPMAMIGIVPTKVTTENGPIHRGDLLVTSSVAGFAMKGTDRSRLVGAVIGKAMGSLENGTSVIEVLVTLQ